MSAVPTRPRDFRTRPLRVLHVATLQQIPKGAGYYSVSFKLSNGLTRCGCNVMNFSPRDEAANATIFRNRKFGVGGANRKLIKVAQAFRPDLVLFGHADVIRPATVAALREALPGAAVAQWNVDTLFEPDNVRRIHTKIDLVDWTFVSTAGPQLRQLGADRHPVAFLPNPVDPGIERTRAFEHPRDALPFDLLFAAGNPNLPRAYAGIERATGETVAELRNRLPGVRWRTPGLDQPFVTGTAYEDVLASSAMGLNLSRRNDVPLYSSDRLAQMAGSGLLVFLDRATGYAEVLGEEGFGFFSTEDELVEKIARFAADDAARRRTAEAGWRAYRHAFDATRVAAYMLDVIFGIRPPALDAWTDAGA